MSFLGELKQRGLVKDVTDPSLEAQLEKGPMTLYAGFDPTADGLHIGHLLPLFTLRRFQDAGHKPIAVVGGATGMVGDPSFKAQERSLLNRDQINENLKGIREDIGKILDLDQAKLVNNADWFEGVSYLDFLRDVGKHFTVNMMLSKESVRARLEDREHGISYTEFSYMLLQAYDFHVLNEREGCTLQIGGSDQWGNIVAGTDLIRRMRAHGGRPEVNTFGMTQPLITKSDGTKFGKTESGAVWLNPKKTSPYEFYQFLLRTPDADVMTLLKFFTFRTQEELAGLRQSLETTPEKREAQRTLAQDLTALVHGQGEVDRAEMAARALFGTEIRELDEATLGQLFSNAPTSTQPKGRLDSGYGLLEALVDTGLCKSKGAARKDVTAGGIYLNNERIQEVERALKAQDCLAGGCVLLRKGKKNYHLIRFQ